MRKFSYKILRLIFLCTIACFNSLFLSAQSVQTLSTPFNIDVREISLTKWDSKEGISYQQVPGANLGATSFEVMDINHFAFLCNSSDEIIIVNRTDSKVVRRINLPFSPRDFAYSKGSFFILAEYQVFQYNQDGKEINKFSFPESYRGVERLIRFNNSTYILLPSGNSLLIESNGRSVESKETEGWITQTGNFILTKLNGNSTYSINVVRGNNIPYEKEFACDKKVAGVYVIGSTDNRLVLDIQTFISENPISVERNIVVIKLNKDGIGAVTAKIKVPDCYYVISNKDVLLNKNGTILNMITAPQGIFVFNLTETISKSVQDYPNFLVREKYHFNDHLIQNEKN